MHRGPVTVGNVLGGSWGPGNWLAYAEEFGLFEADVVLLVVSSHDYADNPTFAPLNEETHPTKRPPSALWEGVTRYLPGYLGFLNSREAATEAKTQSSPPEKDVVRALQDLRRFLELAKKTAKTVLVLQHWERSEILAGKPQDGFGRIRAVCNDLDIPAVSLQPLMSQAMNEGLDVYRDNIHPNEQGQRVIADAILSLLHESLPPPSVP